jgi:DNA-binding LytR/AlgR family response regulator
VLQIYRMNPLNKEFRSAIVIEKDRLLIDVLEQTISLIGFDDIRIEANLNFETAEILNSTLFININQLAYISNWILEHHINPQIILYQIENGKITNFWNNGLIKNNDLRLDRESDEIYVKTSRKLEKIYKKDILYIESDKKYCTIITTQKKYVIRTALKSLDRQLSDKKFIRVHRSYLINQEHIQYIDTQNLNIEIGTEKIAIGRRYQEELYNQLMILH